MKVVILAGGSGTRLWPVSRENYPKQFIKINGESLLLGTYKRFLKLINPEDIYIVTNNRYKFYVINDLSILNAKIEENIILEPVAKNTSAAILLSIKFLTEKKNIKESELIFITPSDHIIIKENEFISAINSVKEFVRDGYISTFGIKPNIAHSGYGYIQIGAKIKKDVFSVKKFTEKPDMETAKKYISDGKYLWNSGMFFFSVKTILTEFKKYKPQMYKFYRKDYSDMINDFTSLESISIDYSIMEKTDRAIVASSDIGWSDIGGWESFGDVMSKDVNGNVITGNLLIDNVKNSIIYSTSEKRLISLIDLEDIMVIDTDDATLITKKGSGEKVKKMVSDLKARNFKEAFEHTTVHRPWGRYTVLEEGPRYKIKRIFVKPEHKLSEQMHYHRSEHWVVIKGTAKVSVDSREYLVHENESMYVPKSTKHRLENPGKVNLELIEVQNGEYVGEDDIVRFDDIYGRK